MPERLTDEQWDQLLRERDLFKLAIRAHAALEADINAALEGEFAGPISRDLRWLPFRARLALVIALDVLPPQLQPGIEALAKLRHALAHGDVADVDAHGARQLVDAFAPIFDVQDKDFAMSLRQQPPRAILIVTLSVARAAVTVSAELAAGRREEVQRLRGEHGVGEEIRAAVMRQFATGAQRDASEGSTPD